MIEKIKAFLNNPVYFITSPASKGYLNWVPDAIYLKILYRLSMGERCNLKNPVKYNEKLQWLKLHDRKPEYARMVDKYEVRGYIAEAIGEEYLIPCYGVYNSFEEIDFSKLPEQFVLKCTHDSGSVEICKDKANFDFKGAKDRLTGAMGKNYYNTYREWPYKNVKPRIIAEKFMVDETVDDLRDYKIMCFNGEAKLIEVHENRFARERGYTQTFYDRAWNKLNIAQKGFIPTDEEREKPVKLDEMLALSEKIAKDMYHARIDWYLIGDKLYFGEITFYDGSGFAKFDDEKDDIFFGSLIQI